MLRCNRRLLKDENLDVGKRIWNSISNLGVVSLVDREANIKIVEKMENIDKEVVKGKKADLIKLLSRIYYHTT